MGHRSEGLEPVSGWGEVEAQPKGQPLLSSTYCCQARTGFTIVRTSDFSEKLEIWIFFKTADLQTLFYFFPFI